MAHPLNAHGNVHVRLVGTSNVTHGLRGGTYSLYLVEVVTDGATSCFWRRFYQFRLFDQQLRQLLSHSDAAIPPLPSASHLRLPTNAFVNERRLALQQYLRQVVECASTSQSKDLIQLVVTFLELDMDPDSRGKTAMPSHDITTPMYLRPTSYDSRAALLTGQLCIVTGGCGAVGRRVVRGLWEKGGTVIVGSTNQNRAESVFRSIAQHGKGMHRLLWMMLDLRSPASITEFVDSVARRSEFVNVLIHNAEVHTRPESEGLSWDPTLAINFLGPFLLSQLLCPELRKASRVAGPARVLFVCPPPPSVAALEPVFTRLAASGAKDMGSELSSKQAAAAARAALLLAAPLLKQAWRQDGFGGPTVNVVIRSGGVCAASDGVEAILHATLAPELETLGGQYLLGTRSKTRDFFSQHTALALGRVVYEAAEKITHVSQLLPERVSRLSESAAPTYSAFGSTGSCTDFSEEKPRSESAHAHTLFDRTPMLVSVPSSSSDDRSSSGVTVRRGLSAGSRAGTPTTPEFPTVSEKECPVAVSESEISPLVS